MLDTPCSRQNMTKVDASGLCLRKIVYRNSNRLLD